MVQRWFRVAAVVFGCLVAGEVVWTLVAEDLGGQRMLIAAVHVLVLLSLWSAGRRRTTVSAEGLRVVDAVRSRTIPWTDVRKVAVDRARWGEESLRVELVDGLSVVPLGVPARAAEDLRRRHQLALEGAAPPS